MTRDEIVAILDKAVEDHNKFHRYAFDQDSGETIDYMGELEFYIPKFSFGDNIKYLGLGSEITLDWSAIGLGPALV